MTVGKRKQILQNNKFHNPQAIMAEENVVDLSPEQTEKLIQFQVS